MIDVERNWGPDGCSYKIDLESHLNATVRTGEELDLDFLWDCDEGCYEEACRQANELLGGEVFHTEGLDKVNIVRDHTFNLENGLSNDFQYSIIPSIEDVDCYYGMVIVLIKRHLGGDPRNGNYAPLEAYVLDHIVDTGFFDWTIGFRATPTNVNVAGESRSTVYQTAEDACEEFNEVCGTGYSQWPWGEVEKMVDSVPENFLGETNAFLASIGGHQVMIEAYGPYYECG